MTSVVIGSGPSGVLAAYALLKKGKTVLMLDVGKDLEAEKVAGWEELAKRAPGEWGETDVEALRAQQYAAEQGQTRRYGSDFAMEPEAAVFAYNPDRIGLRSSHAKGGLSNLWGAATLPYSNEDMSDWPIGMEDLAPHYEAVTRFMPVTGTTNALSQHLGYPGLSLSEPVPTGRQIAAFLERTGQGATGGKVSVFKAQQAVEAGCTQCGLCLHGCPWNKIYSARKGVEHLSQHPNFSYRKMSKVVRVESGVNAARAILEDGTIVSGERVFVACGVLETARIVFASTPLTSLSLKDSSFAFLPFLHRWGVKPRVDQLPRTTLPQAFALLDDKEISDRLVHAQIYGWNEFFERDLLQNYGRKLSGSGPFWKALARRLIATQIFLHSDHSHGFDVVSSGDGRLKAMARTNPDTRKILKRAARSYAKAFRKAGLYGILPAMRETQIGSSFHVGGSLPMATGQKGPSTNTLGQLAGLDRVHFVDASVLPSIAATTITFTVMANAHRIATQTD